MNESFRVLTTFCDAVDAHALIWKRSKAIRRTELFCVVPLMAPYATMTVPVLSAGALSASPDFPDVPAAGSAALLALAGLISVLSVPTSLTQN